MEEVKNDHVATLDSVNDDIRSYCQASQTWTQVVIATATDVRMFGQDEKMVGDRIDQSLGNIGIAALCRHIPPNFVKLGVNFRCNPSAISVAAIAVLRAGRVRGD